MDCPRHRAGEVIVRQVGPETFADILQQKFTAGELARVESLSFFEALNKTGRLGGFVLIHRATQPPEIHTELFAGSGAEKIEAMKLLLELLHRRGHNVIETYVPINQLGTKFMAFAAGFRRTGQDGEKVFYAVKCLARTA